MALGEGWLRHAHMDIDIERERESQSGVVTVLGEG